MRETWSRVADLSLRLDPALGRRAALEKALRAAVQDGTLRAGTQLPSSRLLARDLRLSRGTVVEAYTQLSAEGYLITRPRSGTRVAGAPQPQQPAPPAAPALRYDLRPINSDVGAFPRAAWLRATREVLNSAPPEAFQYGGPAGDPGLRRTLAAYLGRARGVVATAEQIMLCNGFSHALSLICQVLAESGCGPLSMEDPGLGVSAKTVRHAGLAVSGTPVDGSGLRVADLPDQAGAVLITPAHHLPSGITMSAARRRELVDWVGARPGRLVLEDDYDGEFWHEQQPVGAVQAQEPDRIVYLGTASKSLAPGLRLAWMVLPPHLIEPVRLLRRLTDRHTATLPGLTLGRLIDSGAFDRHLRQTRAEYRRRRDVLVTALGAVPRLRLGATAGGYHLTAHLPEGTDETAVVERLRTAGVGVQGLAEYRIDLVQPPALVIGYAAVPKHLFSEAVAALRCGLIESV